MRISIIYFLVCFANIGFAQTKHEISEEQTPRRGVHGTVEYNKMKMEKDSIYKANHDQLNKDVNAFLKRRNARASEEIITIPIVFHVIYENATENISDAQIYSQLDVLNRDFRKQNADTTIIQAAYKSIAADTKIEFCMAQQDPEGNTTTGITRTSTTVPKFTLDLDNAKYDVTGGKDVWNSKEYLNIWVCDLENGSLAYAQFPGGDESTDGVVISYKYFGTEGTATSPYNNGRTLVHEIGHWLNLSHTWGDGDCSVDDGIGDTPICDDELYTEFSSGCLGAVDECGDGVRMTENYMDYSDDGCLAMFTDGQKSRMRAAIYVGRPGILSSVGCQPLTSKPFPNFTSNKTTVFEGATVMFENFSGGESSIIWSFEGAFNVDTSDINYPVVTYNQAGQYDVSLQAFNANGDSVLTQIDYINVIVPPEKYTYTDGFSGSIYTYTSDEGYVSGHNDYEDKAKAEFFENPYPYQYISGVKMLFADAQSNSAETKFKVTVWDGSTGEPTTKLYTEEHSIASIENDVFNGDTIYFQFSNFVSLTGDYFVGIELTYYLNGGGLENNMVALYTNIDGDKIPSTGWELDTFDDWYAMSDSWGLNISYAVYPVLNLSLLLSLEDDQKKQIFIYPNPANDVLNVSTQEPGQELNVFNLLGEKMITQRLSELEEKVDIASLISGVYIASIGDYKIKFLKK